MHKKLLVLAGVLAVGLSATGCAAQAQAQSIEPMVVEQQVVAVEVADVVSEDVYDSIYGIGEIAVADTYQVNALASGKVLEVYFEVGDHVNEGDILFSIETEDFDVDRQSKLTQANNSVSQAKISLNSSKTNLDRVQTLFDGGVSSQAELDQVVSGYDNAKIQYNTAVSSYNSLKHSLDSMSENYEMTSPVSGIITAKSISKDMTASQQNGFTIGANEQYKVTSKIGSKYINNLEMDQEVEIYIPTLDKIVTGHIESISQSGVNGTYPIEITLADQIENLRSGMYAEYWIIVDRTSNGLWIPSLSLIQENGQSFVYTVNEGKAEKVMVEVLSMRGEDIAIKSALTKEQQVITFGKEYVIHGSDVDVK